MQNQGLTLDPPKALYYFIFTVSGFSGLIYESIWSHYLKLFLGHAAYAQSLVLSIFMGGMAVGAWLAGQYSSRLRIPVLAYAAVEGIIGVLALLFHGSFTAITDAAYGSLLPATDSIALAHAMKWTIAALMIVPQSILLGMTFPLMTAGIVRRYPERSGGTIALLYFTNSIGAAAGVLASGFWLIEAVGLPGTIMTAGLINILLALTVWIVIKLDRAPATEALKSAPGPAPGRENRLLLTAAFVTGMASFIYEIGWIRMLSLVLGSSTHAFELMLSAFIAGLAFGGLWIRKRIDSFDSPVRFAGYVQIAMGLLALLTLPLYGLTFEWMSRLIQALNRTDQAYSLLLFASHGIALAVMLPATFCAGMTLPLFTHSLLKTGYGEKSIGRVYAFNTAGAIAGVLLAVNTLPLLGLKNLIGLGALLDIVLGLVLLAFVFGAARRLRLLRASAAVAAAFLVVFVSSRVDPAQLASGVFRYGRTGIDRDSEIYFHRDGKTASISVHGRKDVMLILTSNGKPDASINYAGESSASQDENTMVLAAALPYGFKPDIRTVANVGLGSGLTTHTLLELPQIERVDTIEIESAVIAASREFGDRVALAHTDPRSRIHVEDAKTFFSVNNQRYDLIVSEPSNPWVSGVSSLFTGEFYTQIRRYLAEDGIFTQWMHLYENEWRIIASVLKSLDANFDDYAVYAANDLDILIIARNKGPLGELRADKILGSDLGRTLAKLNIRTPSDLHYRLLGDRDILGPFLRSAPVPANSDYFPYLDTHAHKAFFMGRQSREFRLNSLPLPLLEMLQPRGFHATRQLTLKTDFMPSQKHAVAKHALLALAENRLPEDTSNADSFLKNISVMLLTAPRCDETDSARLWLHNWHELAQFLVANLDAQSALAAWNAPAVRSCVAKADAGLKRWVEFYRSVAARNGEDMHRRAQELLQANAARGPELKEYVFAASMLGAYLSGRPRLAVQTWKQHSGMFKTSDEVPFYFRILVHKAASEL